jgi:beta-glucosidase
MAKVSFPDQFLFGSAISAAQAEGGDPTDGRGLSIWDVFSRIPGTIADGSTPDVACNMYHSYKEDIAIARQMNLQSFRFSFSWSRIFPEGKGRVNQKGLDYYKYMVEELHKQGLIPNATIYHWDLPYELEREGGWLNRDVVDWYGEYASKLFREFGDAIPIWSTVNEPIATYVGYAQGGFAPGRKKESFGRQANHHILMAHGEGVKRFRQENRGDNKIGIVVDIWHHHPYRPDNQEDIRVAELENEKSYRSYLNPIFRGCYTDALLSWMEQNDCMPVRKEKDMELIHQPLDYFGLNCYNRVIDCAEPTLRKQESKPKNLGGNYMDNGSEYYPKAVYDALHILTDDYKIGIPIYITENGTYNCNEEIREDGNIHDQQRIEYMKGFLTWIHKAMEEGIDVRGYYAWSLLDNWEWSAGYTYRFGLVHTAFESQARIWKDSAKWYRDIIGARGFEL